MQFQDTPPGAASLEGVPWWKELTRYQWFVFIVASLGWLFDTMDQQLFTLARISAVTDLLHVQSGDTKMDGPGGLVRRPRDDDFHDRLGPRRASFSGSWATRSAAPRRCC